MATCQVFCNWLCCKYQPFISLVFVPHSCWLLLICWLCRALPTSFATLPDSDGAHRVLQVATALLWTQILAQVNSPQLKQIHAKTDQVSATVLRVQANCVAFGPCDFPNFSKGYQTANACNNHNGSKMSQPTEQHIDILPVM